MRFEDYKKCREEYITVYKQINNTESKDHCIQTVQMNKRVLYNLDDKRFIAQDGIRTYSFGHYLIDNLETS